MSAKSRPAQPSPGTCWICGCTQTRACPEGCAWWDPEQNICTACVMTIAGAVSTAIMGLVIERASRMPPRKLRDDVGGSGPDREAYGPGAAAHQSAPKRTKEGDMPNRRKKP